MSPPNPFSGTGGTRQDAGPEKEKEAVQPQTGEGENQRDQTASEQVIGHNPDQERGPENFQSPVENQMEKESGRDYYYILPGGACRYCCADGTNITCANSIITDWEERHEAEFEANVRAGIFRKVRASEIRQSVERPIETSVISR